MLHPSAEGTGSGKFTIRAVHLVDPAGVLQLSMMYPTTTGARLGCLLLQYIFTVCLFGHVPVCPVGRNFTEILRCLDSLQLAAKHKARSPMRRCSPCHLHPSYLFHDMIKQIGTPANWRPGEDVVILPSVDDEEAARTFPKGFTSIKPYLRITATPDD